MAIAAKLITLALTGMLVSGVAQARAALPEAPPPPSHAYDPAPWWMKDNVITQTGLVFADVPANRASFTATFLSVADTADKAQAKAIDRTRALNQALTSLGSDNVRVSTDFSMRALYEEYRDKNGNRIEDQRGDKINGYQVSLMLSLDVRDMSVLEKAYALVLAATPTETTNVAFRLQPSNETNSWLYGEAVKDARRRATAATEAAGGHLGAIKVIDPTGRACETDILARAAPERYAPEPATEVEVTGYRSSPMAKKSVTSSGVGDVDSLEALAVKNPFVQTPPMQRIEAKACVVYGVD